MIYNPLYYATITFPVGTVMHIYVFLGLNWLRVAYIHLKIFLIIVAQLFVIRQLLIGRFACYKCYIKM
jgi:hypothetical protein